MPKYITLHSYHLKPKQEEEFLSTWKMLSDLFFRYAGCISTRIHRRTDQLNYYEYIIWPDKEAYFRAEKALPPAALALKARLRSYCKRVEEVVELEPLAEHRVRRSSQRDFT